MEYYNNYYEGVFWTHGNENSKVIANLHIDAKGEAIITSLQPINDNEENETTVRKWKKKKVILGYINCHNNSKNYSIKLYNVVQIFQSYGPLTKFKYQSSYSFITSMFDSRINNLSYDSVMLNSNILSQWVPISGFDSNFEKDEFNTFKATQLYKQPKKIELFKDDKYYIYLCFRVSAGHPLKRKSYIEEEVFLNIETNESFELEELYKLKAIVERLLSIILFTPFHSTVVEFKSNSKKNYKELAKSNEFSISESNQLKFEKFLENSKDIFKRWFEKQNKFELLIKNFFSVYGQKGVLIENKFLTYVSVLENYHKNNIKKKSILKDRLNYILKKSSIHSKIDNIDNCAEKITVTRNYHVHLDENLKEKVLNLDGIMKFNKLLEVMIQEIMLREINILEFKIPNWLEKLISGINECLN